MVVNGRGMSAAARRCRRHTACCYLIEQARDYRLIVWLTLAVRIAMVCSGVTGLALEKLHAVSMNFEIFAGKYW